MEGELRVTHTYWREQRKGYWRVTHPDGRVVMVPDDKSADWALLEAAYQFRQTDAARP